MRRGTNQEGLEEVHRARNPLESDDIDWVREHVAWWTQNASLEGFRRC